MKVFNFCILGVLGSLQNVANGRDFFKRVDEISLGKRLFYGWTRLKALESSLK